MTGCERSPGMLAYVRWRPSRVRGLMDRHRREKAHQEVREASEEQTLHCRRVSLRGYSSDGAWRFATEDRREPVAGARYIYIRTMAIESETKIGCGRRRAAGNGGCVMYVGPGAKMPKGMRLFVTRTMAPRTVTRHMLLPVPP